MKLSKWSGLLCLLPAVLLVGAVLVGCGDDDGSKPRAIVISDFEGSWVATSYRATSVRNPEVSIEFIALGGGFGFEVDDAGAFTGRMFVPPSFVGFPWEQPFQGSFELVSQDSIQFSFAPEIPPFLTDTRAAFTYARNTFSITDTNTTFDFDGDQVEEPAIFEGTLVRFTGTPPSVIFSSDFEGSWETVAFRMTSDANPQISIEVISLGATFDFVVNNDGEFVGDAFIPASIAGQDFTISDVMGSLSLATQDTMLVTFSQEMPPFLPNLRGGFTLIGNTFTLTSPDATFDFDGDGGVEPADFEGVFQRSSSME